jgi:hypothetical protein
MTHLTTGLRLPVLLALLWTPLAAGSAGAQGSGTTAPAPAARPAPCSAPEYRQFDFWLGDWDVTTPDGKPAGRNTVTRPLGDCVLQEHWRGAGGTSGESYNLYDASSGRWHQRWVDGHGMLLLLDGGLVNGAMVLSGGDRNVGGKTTRDRITWRPEGDAVHQIWEQSTDSGKTWSVVFHGIYRPRK